MRKTYDSDEILGNNLVEPSRQILNLVLDGRMESVLRRKLDKLPLVLLSDYNALTTLLQRNDAVDTELKWGVSTQCTETGERNITSSASTLKFRSRMVGSFSKIQQSDL